MASQYFEDLKMYQAYLDTIYDKHEQKIPLCVDGANRAYCCSYDTDYDIDIKYCYSPYENPTAKKLGAKDITIIPFHAVVTPELPSGYDNDLLFMNDYCYFDSHGCLRIEIFNKQEDYEIDYIFIIDGKPYLTAYMNTGELWVLHPEELQYFRFKSIEGRAVRPITAELRYPHDIKCRLINIVEYEGNKGRVYNPLDPQIFFKQITTYFKPQPIDQTGIFIDLNHLPEGIY